MACDGQIDRQADAYRRYGYGFVQSKIETVISVVKISYVL